MTQQSTINFGFTLLYANQAQKDVVVNTDLVQIDGLIQLSVLDRTLNTPPSSPADQEKHIVGPAPTGAWGGQANSIAVYQASGAYWTFYTPQNGWLAYSLADLALFVWQAGVWTELAVSFDSNSNLGTLGALPSADVTNLVSLSELTPGGGSIIVGNGSGWTTQSLVSAFQADQIMYAIIFGG